MSKADKMFEDRGYIKSKDRQHCYLRKDERGELLGFIMLYEETKQIELRLVYGAIGVEEHLAIHQKMKELGWLHGQ